MANAEKIVAAAIRVQTPEVFRRMMHKGKPIYPEHIIVTAPPPARHATLLHTAASDKLVGPEDQGFLTSEGRFVGRREALAIVEAAGQPQIDHPSKNAGGQLFSEDLW